MTLMLDRNRGREYGQLEHFPCDNGRNVYFIPLTEKSMGRGEG